jgi:hypothetical protein
MCRRIFNVALSAQEFCKHMLREYILLNKLYPLTIVNHLIRLFISPLKSAFSNKSRCHISHDGAIDTFRDLF